MALFKRDLGITRSAFHFFFNEGKLHFIYRKKGMVLCPLKNCPRGNTNTMKIEQLTIIFVLYVHNVFGGGAN